MSKFSENLRKAAARCMSTLTAESAAGRRNRIDTVLVRRVHADADSQQGDGQKGDAHKGDSHKGDPHKGDTHKGDSRKADSRKADARAPAPDAP